MPNSLLCAFESGYNALAGVRAVDIDKWSTFKLVLRQLKSDEAKEMYHTIIIDTIGDAYIMCEDYICSQQGVSSIKDIPYGAGYGMVEREFQKCFQQIAQMGYGIISIAHEDTKKDSDTNGAEIDIIAPKIPKRGYNVINQFVDIIGYIDVQWNEDGTSRRYLYTRKTPQIMAGSRFKYLPTRIPFGYEELTKAIGEAIDREAAETNSSIVDHHIENQKDESSFEEIREEARVLWMQLIEKNPDRDKAKNNAEKIGEIIQEIFGRPVKLSEITKEQKDLFELVVVAMKEL